MAQGSRAGVLPDRVWPIITVVALEVELGERVQGCLAHLGLDVVLLVIGQEGLGNTLSQDDVGASDVHLLFGHTRQITHKRGFHLDGNKVGDLGDDLIEESLVLIFEVLVHATLAGVEGAGGDVSAIEGLAALFDCVLVEDVMKLLIRLEGVGDHEPLRVGLSTMEVGVWNTNNRVEGAGNGDVAHDGLGRRTTCSNTHEGHGTLDSIAELTNREVHVGHAHQG